MSSSVFKQIWFGNVYILSARLQFLFFFFVVLCRGNHCQIVPYGTFLLYSLQNFLLNCTVHFCFIFAAEIIIKSYRTSFFIFALGMLVKLCCTFLLYICHGNHCQRIGIINVLSLCRNMMTLLLLLLDMTASLRSC